MKTLHELLREEYQKILKEEDISNKILISELKKNILDSSFETLLKFKSDPSQLDRAKTEIINNIVNQLISEKK